MLQQDYIIENVDESKLSRASRSNLRSLRLSALLSTTALAFFLEGCGSGGGGSRPEVSIDSSTAGGVNRENTLTIEDTVSGDIAHYSVTSRDIVAGEFPDIEGRAVTELVEMIEVDGSGNAVPGGEVREVIKALETEEEVDAEGNIVQVTTLVELTLLPGNRQVRITEETRDNEPSVTTITTESLYAGRSPYLTEYARRTEIIANDGSGNVVYRLDRFSDEDLLNIIDSRVETRELYPDGSISRQIIGRNYETPPATISPAGATYTAIDNLPSSFVGEADRRDIVDYSSSTNTDGIDIDLRVALQDNGDTLTSIDGVIGSDYDDVLIGNEFANILEGGDGADVINGEGGEDTVSYAGSDAGVSIGLGEAGAIATTGDVGDEFGDEVSNIENIIGSEHIDELIGNSEDNVIEGGDSADKIDGGGGEDTVSYAGSDAGVRLELADAGGFAFGVDGHASGDEVSNIENIIGSEHIDELRGNSGDNVIEGGAGADIIDGGEGEDTVSYASSDAGVSLELAEAGDFSIGDGGHALGDDVSNIENIIGSGEVDELRGNSEDNVIEGGDGEDTLVGGEGSDTVSYEGSDIGVVVNLDVSGRQTAENADGTRRDIISGFENIIGSSGADELRGNSEDNIIEGGDGDDTLIGGGGSDTVSYEGSDVSVVVTLDAGGRQTAEDASGTRLDTISGFENIIGSAGEDVLSGNSGDNVIEGGGGADILVGGDGVDTLSYADSPEGRVNGIPDGSGVAIDLYTGSASGGDAEGDTIGGFENIIGSAYDDSLTGNREDNLLEGGAGDDTYNYHYTASRRDGADRVSDADGGVIRIFFDSDVIFHANYNGVITEEYFYDNFLVGRKGVVLSRVNNDVDSADYNDMQLTFDGAGNSIIIEGAFTSKARLESFDIVLGSASDSITREISGAFLVDKLGDSLSLNFGPRFVSTGYGDQDFDGSSYSDERTSVTYDGILSPASPRNAGLEDVGITVDLSNKNDGVARQEDDRRTYAIGDLFNAIDDVTGTENDDVLIGDEDVAGEALAKRGNILRGLGGDDVLRGNGGADFLYGGDNGQEGDTVSYAGSPEGMDTSGILDGSGVTVSLLTNSVSGGDAEGDTIRGFENVLGSSYNDELTGDNSDNRLEGGGGADILDGNAGADIYRYYYGASSDSRKDGMDTISEAGANIEENELELFLAINDLRNFDIEILKDSGVILTRERVLVSTGPDVFVHYFTIRFDGGNYIRIAEELLAQRELSISIVSNGVTSFISAADLNIEFENSFTTFVGTADVDTFVGEFDSSMMRRSTVSYEGSPVGVTIDLSLVDANGFQSVAAGWAVNDRISDIAHIIGSSVGNDVLTGDDGINEFRGLGGMDVLTGGVGNDRLYGGAGVDELYGGDDNDLLDGGADGDTLDGGAGVDTLDGGDGDDTLIGGAEGDTLDGGADIDTLSYAGSTAGGVTIDLNLAGNGFQTASGGDADGDTISGFENVIGGDGGDTITGDGGVNGLVGGAGDDTLIGGAGGDTLDGGADIDTLSYAGSTAGGVTINLDDGGSQTASGGDAAGDIISGFEHVTGGAGDDTIRGNTGFNILEGGAGNDRIIGGGDGDTLDGGAGDSDTISYEDLTATVTVNLDAIGGQSSSVDTISGFENVIGGDAGDIITGDGGVNILEGGLGDDTLIGGGGGDTLDGGADVDTLSYAGSTAGGVTIDLNMDSNGFQTASDGDAAGDTISGFENVIGGDGGDTITGGAGVNDLDGGLGDDTIAGGAEGDVLVGGAGVDTVSYADSPEGMDVNGILDGSGVNVDLVTNSVSGGDAESDTISLFENVIGSAYDDELMGDDEANELRGLGGIDMLTGGAGNDRLYGGDDGDTLDGGAGVDTLDGGAGDDTLIGGAEGDTLDGGADVDTLSYAGSTAGAVTINLDDGGSQTASGGDAEGDTISGFENVIGGNAGDIITGDIGVNRLVGGAGDDTLIGGGGGDMLEGGADVDTLSYAGSTATVIVNLDDGGSQTASGGDAAGDTISGFENVTGGDGDDEITGDDEANVLEGGAGSDTLKGGIGDDTYVYHYGTGMPGSLRYDGTDMISDSDGLNTVQLRVASLPTDWQDVVTLVSDTLDLTFILIQFADINGEAQHIRISHSDMATGNYQLELIAADGSSLSVSTLELQDALPSETVLYMGVTPLVGTDGTSSSIDSPGSTVSFAGQTSSVELSLTDGMGMVGTMPITVSGFTGIVSGDAGDVLTGNDQSNILLGGIGMDTLSGEAGDDLLRGGDGDDTLIGGAGIDTLEGGGNDVGGDTLSYAGSTATVIVNLDAGGGSQTASGGDAAGDTISGFENVTGGDGDDEITGDDEANVLEGGAGSDTLKGGIGDDTYVYHYGTGMPGSLRYDGTDMISDSDGLNTVQLRVASLPTDWQDVVTLVIDTLDLTFILIQFAAIGGEEQHIRILRSDIAAGSYQLELIAADGSSLPVSVLELQDALPSETILYTGVTPLVGTDGTSSSIDSPGSTVSFAGQTSSVELSLTDGMGMVGTMPITVSGFTGIVSGDAGDVLTGNDQSNILLGGAGDDTLIGGGGGDRLDGGADIDTLSYAGSTAGGVTINLDDGGSQTASGGDAAGDIISGFEHVTGGAGDDTIRGNTGFNILEGGAGNDRIIGGGDGDTLDGGAGDSDTISYEDLTATVTVNLDAIGGQSSSVDTISGFENVIGGDAGDIITGNGEANILDGGLGDDTIIGGGGGDMLDGGADVDTLSYAGSPEGVDMNGMLDGSGVKVDLLTNSVSGGDAEDDIISGFENVIGSAYNDVLTGGAGVNDLDGGAGDDTITGGAEGDVLVGGNGEDTVSYVDSPEGMDLSGILDGSGVIVDLLNNFASGGDAEGDTLIDFENVIGSAYDDELTGDDEANELRGLGGIDMLTGGLGNDRLYGGAGDDTLIGGEGSDTLDGEADIDTLSYADSPEGVDLNGIPDGSGVSVDLLTNSASGGDAEGDTISNFENVIGSAYDDELTGDVGVNILEGGAGDDTLIGGGGGDTLEGGDGDDTLIGGAGSDTLEGGVNDVGGDTLSYAGSTATVIVNLDAGGGSQTASGGDAAGDTISGFENVTGGDGDDEITGDDEANVLEGGAGSDTLKGGIGDDTYVYHYGTGMPGSLRYDGTDMISDSEGLNTVQLRVASLPTDWQDVVTLVSDTLDSTFILIQFAAIGGEEQHIRILRSDIVAGSYQLELIAADDSSLPVSVVELQDALPSETILYTGVTPLVGTDGTSSSIDSPGSTVSFAGQTSSVELSLTDGMGMVGTTPIMVSDFTGIVGGDAGNVLTGNDQSNILLGGAGMDTLNGEDGDDLLRGGDEVDILNGGDGDDILEGGAGVDTLNGGAGDDILEGGAGGDTLDGGDGTSDTLSYAGSPLIAGGVINHLGVPEVLSIDGERDLLINGIIADLLVDRFLGGDAAGDTISNFENVRGSANNDEITGDDNDNRLEGEGGDDWLSGGVGADTLVGGAGNDIAYGGAGADIFIAGAGDDDYRGDVGNDIYRYHDPASGNINYGIDVIMDASGVNDIEIILDDTRYAAVASETEVIDILRAAGINSFGENGNYYQIKFNDDSCINIRRVDVDADRFRIVFDDVENFVTPEIIIDAVTLKDFAAMDGFAPSRGIDTTIVPIITYSTSVAETATLDANSIAYANGEEIIIDITELDSGVINRIGNLFAEGKLGFVRDGSSIDLMLVRALGDETSILTISNAFATIDSPALTDSFKNLNIIFKIITDLGPPQVATGVDAELDIYFTEHVVTSYVPAGTSRTFAVTFASHFVLGLDDASADIADFSDIGNLGGIRVNLNIDLSMDTGKNAELRVIEGFGVPVGGGTLEHSLILKNIEGIIGFQNNDRLIGNDRVNIIEGRLGNDLIEGGAGGDRLYGGAGDDMLIGDLGGDTLDGGAGVDTLIGGEGSDTLDGGAGEDTVSYVDSPEGVDTRGIPDGSGVKVDLLNNSASGGDAEGDTLSNFENVIGSAYDDELTGDGVVNRLEGGTGDDTLIGGAMGDTLDGGADVDTLSYAGSTAGGVTINLDAGGGSQTASGGDAEGDTISNFENVIGGAGNDELTGDGGVNRLVGGLGDDTLIGGAGGDTLDGGADIDTLSYAGSTATVIVNLDDGGSQTASGGDAAGDTISNFENVVGGARDDTITGDGNANVLEGGAGGDTLVGGGGEDTLSYAGSTAGDVTINLDDGGSQTASGGDAGGDIISGFENVIGGAGDDTITGDGNANVLEGGAGVDTLSGGDGNDRLIGGGAADIYGYEYDATNSASTNLDSIIDDTIDEIRIDLSNFYSVAPAAVLTEAVLLARLIADGALSRARSGDDLELTFGATTDSNVLTIENFYTTPYGGTPTIKFQYLDAPNFDWTSAPSISFATLEASQVFDVSGTTPRVLTPLELGRNLIIVGDNSDANTLSYARVATGTGVVITSTAAGSFSVERGVYSDFLASIENIIGTGEDDEITGDGNANVIAGGAGADVLNGGEELDDSDNSDTLDYAASLEVGGSLLSINGVSITGVIVNLATDRTAGGDAEGDTISNFENVIGTPYNDALSGNSEVNILEGGAGEDVLGYFLSNTAVVINLDDGGRQTASGGHAEGDTISGFEHIIGSQHGDELTGDIKANRITSGIGVDTIMGMGGDDIIRAGDDMDTIYGGAGADTINGGDGNDILEGGIGNDMLFGDDGADEYVFRSGDGSDTIAGDTDGGDLYFADALGIYSFEFVFDDSDSSNHILTITITTIDSGGVTNTDEVTIENFANNNFNIFYGTSKTALGAVNVEGAGAVTDTDDKRLYIIDTSSTAFIFDAGGDDTYKVIKGSIQMDASTSTDDNTVLGGDAVDYIIGGSGDDTIDGGGGGDTLLGEDGDDTLSYAGSTAGGVTINLDDGGIQTSSGGDAAGDTIAGFENVIGGAGVDTITGDGNANVLEGGAGVDTLTGGAGGDTLVGGVGADAYDFYVGDGTDRVSDVDGGQLYFRSSGGGDYTATDFASAFTRPSGSDDLEINVRGQQVTVTDYYTAPSSFSIYYEDQLNGGAETLLSPPP